ncbi:lipase family protein [Salinisphaera sp. T5B8]|uniref:lipase family protein n=1 Tax=Salinisphaera sp. T5B8 TaxID=1304154 RepID=UPI003340B6FD
MVRRGSSLTTTWLAALAAVSTTVAIAQTALAAPADTAPGAVVSEFYTPPSPLPGAQAGDVIRSRALTNDAALPHAASNHLVLYRSTDINGDPIAVSGTVAIPRGEAPAGGWPVISWTHGTTGTADVCAPSLNDVGYRDKDYVDRINKTLDRWVQLGYAVVKTDYQGSGTPGPHPYLNGESEARNAVDIVRAARALSDDLSTNWLVMGHSQGGQAAWFTAGRGEAYAPELHLVGAVALAPASHLEAIIQYFQAHADQPASPFLPLVLEGAAASADTVNPQALTTDAGQAVLKLAGERCLNGLRKPDALGDLTTAQFLKADANYQPLYDVLDVFGGSEHVYPSVPLLVLQATNDRIVPKVYTDQAVAKACNLGAPVDYRSYTIENADTPPEGHRGTVEASFEDARAWIAARFAGEAAEPNCSD